MAVVVENAGSNARDFCMLERNLLAALKLACLLCVLFAAVLLRGRLRIDAAPAPKEDAPAALAFAGLYCAAALAVVGGAMHEYHAGVQDLRGARAFFRSGKCVRGVEHICGMLIVLAPECTSCSWRASAASLSRPASRCSSSPTSCEAWTLLVRQQSTRRSCGPRLQWAWKASEYYHATRTARV
jgi:hypothetical protein